MHTIDYVVIGCYLIALILAGAWLARRAGSSVDDYFLGGHRLPWWALGASGMSSNLDVAGTMTIVAMVTLFGLHGLWIEMRGGVVLPIAVFLAFMGKWHRRSGVMTTAEWMTLRFGAGPGGTLARLAAAGTYIIITVAMIVFFLSAGGSFLAAFLPFAAWQCTLGIAVVAFVYTLVGGLYGVIWTDVAQAILIGAAAIYVSITASTLVTPELLANWPGAKLNSFLPRMIDPALGEYSLFFAFLAVWVFKGVLEGLGGSGGSAYMAQRFYAAGSDADCRKIGMLWTVLFAARWPMVLGFAIMAMALGMEVRTPAEAEGVLPAVLGSSLFPPGVRGLVIAAMLAAAMSTFDSTINAGASYLVRDVYGLARPDAAPREQVWAGYVSSALLVALGLLFTYTLGAAVLSLWVGIVMLLFPAFLVPFALRWYWARFNGGGFTGGVVGGFATAAFFSRVQPAGFNEATQFLAISGVSLGAALLGTFSTRPVPVVTLRIFFERVRPFGIWPSEWKGPAKAEHRGDVVLLLVALIWQTLTFLIPMGLVLQMWSSALPALVLWAAAGWLLWKRRAV